MDKLEELEKKILELKLNDKILVFPTKLREMINASKELLAKEKTPYVSFIALYPIGTKVIIPGISEQLKDDTVAKLDEEEAGGKTKIKEIKLKGIDAIILPIRPTADTIVGQWQSVEGMNLGGGLGEYIKWKGYKALSGIASTILPQEVVFAMKSGAFGGGIDNPHDKLAYAGHARRNFDLAWEFMKPRNREEEEILAQIVSVFRITSVGAYGDYVITPPINWRVEFSSFPSYKKYLVYRRCGISNITTQFGGNDGNFKAMESGLPFLNLSISFNELDYIGVNGNKKKDLYLKPNFNFGVDESTRTPTEKELEKQKNNREKQKKLFSK